MNLIKFSIRRPTAVSMFYVAILFTGLASLSRLPLELTPEVDFPKLSVSTLWPDSSPEAVEAFVTAPIEAVANTVTNVRKVSSTSEEGESTVELEFTRGTNMDFAALELNEKLSIIREELPYGTLPPRIQKYVPREFETGDFLSYHLTGPYSLQEIRKFALERLRTPLLGVEGVVDVQVIGGQDREIRIELDEEKLRVLGLSVEQVTATLSDMEVRLTAGKLIQGGRRWELLVDNPVREGKDIENLIIDSQGGRLIRVKDIARVLDTYGQPRRLSRIDGHPEVVINIEKEAGTNTIRVADAVFRKLEQLKKILPPGLELYKERDQGEEIRKELSHLSSRSAFCILVILLVLLAFLRSLKTPLIILSTIFFSVLLTINFFFLAQIGLNLLTLAGLALGFGMLVDNSIVVLDNIYRLRQSGVGTLEACEQGTTEVVLPIVAATLTTVAAFIPFLYLTGELRLYYFPFAMAVGLSLLSSMLVAFSLTPSLSARFLKRKKHGESEAEGERRRAQSRNQKPMAAKQEVAQERRFSKSVTFYQRFLDWALRHRVLMLFLVLMAFGGSFYLFNKYVTKGTIFAWGRDTYIRVSIRMPPGAELETTDSIARKFEEKLLGNENIKHFYANVTDEYAFIVVLFPEEIETTAIPLILKEQLVALAVQFAGVDIGVYGFGPGFFGGGGAAPQFQLKVLGYNYNEVKRIAEDVGRRLQRHSRVRDVNTSRSGWFWRDDLFEMVLRLNRDKLSAYQLTAAEVLQKLQGYLRESFGWQRIKLGGREVAYRIKMRGYQDFDLANLQALILDTRNDQTVRLSQIGEISERKVLSRIVREDQQYQRWVTFEYRGPYKLGDRLVENLIQNTHLPPGYKLERGTFFFLGEEEKQQIYLVLALSVLLVYMVTAALFESLRHPLVIILTVPMALIGVFLIFYLTDTPFDRSAYIGVILLGGIVVNNAIILVDHINFLRRKGAALLEAVINGASHRVRPILMTTATTVMGLLPLVLFTQGEQSLWYSLALATIGGLLSSTVLVLTVIPVLYLSLEKPNLR